MPRDASIGTAALARGRETICRFAPVAMPNPYFQFKQFTIYQDQCAMKVSTDACVFGAWMARVIRERHSVGRILDIGTGTGLLSLMVAQQNSAAITAVEIQPECAAQAMSNIAASPWDNRIEALNGDINDLIFEAPFDTIITNPPFFSGDLRSEEAGRNLARHGDTLSLSQLIHIFRNNLIPEGVAGILLPFHRIEAFLAAARDAGFYCKQRVLLRQTPAHSHFRGMLLLGIGNGATVERELVIRDGPSYTPAFVDLLQDYYLHL